MKAMAKESQPALCILIFFSVWALLILMIKV